MYLDICVCLCRKWVRETAIVAVHSAHMDAKSRSDCTSSTAAQCHRSAVGLWFLHRICRFGSSGRRRRRRRRYRRGVFDPDSDRDGPVVLFCNIHHHISKGRRERLCTHTDPIQTACLPKFRVVFDLVFSNRWPE